MATDPAAGRELVERAGGEGSDRLVVGYNLRFHEPLERFAALLADGRVGTPTAYRFWFGSWLPDWRPDTDYRRAYSARSDLGGGVLLDAIHELDLAVWMVDRPMHVVGALVDRLGPLEIDVEDTVRALLSTDRCAGDPGLPVSIELDYLSRQYRRGVEVTGDLATMRYDWATGLLEVFEPGQVVTERFETPVSLSYEREMAHLLDVHEGRAVPRTTAATGLRSLELAHEIRRFSRTAPTTEVLPA